MNIALVHDYLNQYGGAERVLEALHALYPDAPVYTSLYDRARMPATFQEWDIRTSFLQRLPRRVQVARLYLALYPRAFASFDLRGYDVILSSSSAFAKGVVPPDGAPLVPARSTTPRSPGTVSTPAGPVDVKGAPLAPASSPAPRPAGTVSTPAGLVDAKGVSHICYCHNPARFLWNTEAYLASERIGRMVAWLIEPLLAGLRQWDRTTNERVHAFIANSNTVAARIARFYGRESTVIHPPAAVASFPLAQGRGEYYLTGGRLVPHKRFDVAVDACTRLGLPLRVFGTGRDRPRLEKLAGPTVRFLGRVTEEDLRLLYRDCRAFLFPSEEDFGISVIEAMACGRPVIAYAAGGALETVVPGRTGSCFAQQTPESLSEALETFRDGDYDPQEIRRHAEQFDVPVFQDKIRAFVQRFANG